MALCFFDPPFLNLRIVFIILVPLLVIKGRRA